MSQPLYFLDVNVPMYAAGTQHPYRNACVWVMRQVAEGRLHVVIDTEIVQEILYRYGALRRWTAATTLAENVLDLVSSVYPVTAVDIRKTVDLFKTYAPKGVEARDLLHAAVMLNHGIDNILSTDEHFDRLVEVTRLDPRELHTRDS